MKKFIRRKTDKEILDTYPLELTKVSELRPYDASKWWCCGRCKMFFMADDVILYSKNNNGTYKCPLTKGFFGKKCLSSLNCAEPSYFKEKYVIIE